MPLKPQPKIRINGWEMNLTHHGVCCTIFIQRLWRMSWRHRTTRKLMEDLSKTQCRWRDLACLRLDEIRHRLKHDPQWAAYLPLARRLVILSQLRVGKGLKHSQKMVHCFDEAHLGAANQLNMFIGECGGKLYENAVAALDSFERMVLLVRNRQKEIPLGFLRDFAEKIQAAHAASNGGERIIGVYKQALSMTTSIQNIVLDYTRYDPDMSLTGTLSLPVEYLRGRVREITTPTEYSSFIQTHVTAACRDIVPHIKAEYDWFGRIPLDEVLEYERLMDPSFVFTEAHEARILTIDALNRVADPLVEVIRSELEARVDATESIIIWHTLLETALKASMPLLLDTASLQRQRDTLRAGRTTWDGMMTLMDSMAAAIGHNTLWIRERAEVRSKRPNAITAFVYGLRVLWKMMREANIRRINLRPSNADIREKSYEMLARGLRIRLTNIHDHVYVIESRLRETAATYPGLRKFVIHRVKGARLSLHALFVTHVMFRRESKLTGGHCPATLRLAGPRLLKLRQKAHRLSDMAILMDACRDEEERTAALAHIKKNPGLDVVPMFMPMLTRATVDRTIFADTYTRGTFEKNLVKFLTLAALERVSQKLPSELACIQDQLDNIVCELRLIIETDRAIFRQLYGELIPRIFG